MMQESTLVIANIYRRGVGFILDEVIISVIRIVVLCLIYVSFFKENLMQLSGQVYERLNAISDNATLIDVINVVMSLDITSWIIGFAFIFVIISPIYQIVMYKIKNGQTFGKKATDLIVLRKDKTFMSFGDMFARVIFAYIPWCLPALIYHFYTMGNIIYFPILVVWFFWYDPWILFRERGVALHDLLSGTRVFLIEKILPESDNAK